MSIRLDDAMIRAPQDPLLARWADDADRDVAVVDDVERDAAQDDVGQRPLAMGADDDQIGPELLGFVDDRRAGSEALDEMHLHRNADLVPPFRQPIEHLLTLLLQLIEHLGCVETAYSASKRSLG